MTRLTVLLACVAAVGCAHAPEYRGRVRVQSAELVPVNPDVKTVADADKPLFFSRGFFWLFHDGGWWRAERVTSEVWVKVEHPPVPVKQILNPYAFTNYRDAEATRTAARETKASPLLQQSLVRPARPELQEDSDRKPADATATEEPKGAAPAAPTERSADPSNPNATIDKPAL